MSTPVWARHLAAAVSARTSPRQRRILALIITFSLILGACGTQLGAEDNTTSPASQHQRSRQRPEPAQHAKFGSSRPRPDAEIHAVSRRQWSAMTKAGMVRPECPIKRRGSLRVVEVNHYDFEGRVKRGRLVVNADVALSVAKIFIKLFERRFPIRKMVPIEAFDGDTNASLAADNTSAFNCRRPDQINAPFEASPHANGRAVDINPRENPWRDLRCDCWLPSSRMKKRDGDRGKIAKGGVVWRTFRAEGWIWQDIDVPDYMHFDTGYPSTPAGRKPSG